MTKSHNTPPWLVWRSICVVGIHLAVFTAAYWSAFALRFQEVTFPADLSLALWTTLPGVLIVKLIVFHYLGQYRASWRSVTFSDLAMLLKAVGLSFLVITGCYFLMGAQWNQLVGRWVPFYDAVITVMVLGGLRAFYRLSREEFRWSQYRSGARKALIVGANQSGLTLARHLYTEERPEYLVLGFLDDDAKVQGSMLGGLPVLGPPSRAQKIAVQRGVEELLVISGSLSGKDLRHLMESCADVNVSLKVIPAMEDLLAGDYSFQIRNVDIDDLLRREPVQLSSDDIATLLADRTVLVTGAGGSIGSEICRQVLRFRPRRLVLVERAENSLFLIEQELRRSKTETELFPCIADITDYARIDQLLGLHRPAVVFHAAAHKHVPMMESNPGEAIKNNVGGTKTLVELADQHGVQEFVMISTDKAVNPTSVMGVSKQVAERFVHAFSEVATTKFVVVRFGNVLASAGSVVPIFQDQIRRGGPITVTHPEIERYFMTIPEASQLVLQAAAMGKGGEIFVLDMGESIRIVDLAQDLIRLSGLDPEDIEIVFSGLHPGEKLYEELYFDDEEMLPTPHPKLFVAYHRPYRLAEVNQLIDEMVAVVNEPSAAIVARIRQLLPDCKELGVEQQPASSSPAESLNGSSESSEHISSAEHLSSPAPAARTDG